MTNKKSKEIGKKPYPFRDDDLNIRPEIIRIKHTYGTLYGVVVGLTFAISTWGLDGFVLSQAHMFLPWLKLVIGGILCGLTAGLAGWIVARFERWYLAVPAWIGVAAFFAWLLVVLPLQITPMVSAWLQPAWKELIRYDTFDQLLVRFWVAFTWVFLFVLITGLVQIPFVEFAGFSVSIFGKIGPFLLGMVIIGLSGYISDSINNRPLRMAVLAINHSIQFTLDHKGLDVDPALSRANYAGAVRSIKDQVTPERSMTVGKYDAFLGEINVIVQFQEQAANCTVIYEQPTFCKPVGPE